MDANRAQTLIGLDVSVGSSSEVAVGPRDVRCSPRSRHRPVRPTGPFSARSRLIKWCAKAALRRASFWFGAAPLFKCRRRASVTATRPSICLYRVDDAMHANRAAVEEGIVLGGGGMGGMDF